MYKSDFKIKLSIFVSASLMIGLTLPLNAGINGGSLYRDNCAACHGYAGKGGVGVPLSLEGFQSTVSDHYLFETIRNGRPGRVMPAFKQFSDAQINAIVKHLRTFTKAKAAKFSNKALRGNLKNGKALYAKNCASCHGDKGEGGTGTGVTFSRPRNLPIIAPSLSNPGFLKSASDQMIETTLIKGRKGTPMVSFLKRGLTRKDIKDIVVYVRSFEKQKRKNEFPKDDKKAFIKIKSAENFKTTVENIKRSVIGHNFKLIRVQYLNQGMVEKGSENKKQVIVYFCNFRMLNNALAIDPRVGQFLPCRLTIIENKAGVFIYAINPYRLSALFNNKELNKSCGGMRKTYMDIIEEATL